MKAFITKYALSSGIEEGDFEVSQRHPEMISMGYSNFHGEGREWHRTKEEAVARAEAMRVKRIASLEKQIAKLKALTFD